MLHRRFWHSVLMVQLQARPALMLSSYPTLQEQVLCAELLEFYNKNEVLGWGSKTVMLGSVKTHFYSDE